MSLNGLDKPEVAEAYQSALSEAGGWFLLRYVSRDEIEILQNGKGGLAEARNAVSSYDKRSPLYGFLLYRRRKILIKYIPEGTSRLLQARVTVHFQAVTEKFSPYDTIFPISAPEDLNDMTLTAACALHTEKPPGSSHATASSPKKKLDEITEDAEEPEEDTPKREFPALKADPVGDVSSEINSPITPITPSTDLLVTPTEQTSLNGYLDFSPGATTDSESTQPYVYDAYDRRPSDTSTLTRIPTGQSMSETDARMSQQTIRPPTSDIFNTSSTSFKPKLKLGPRPMQTPEPDGRPKTAGARPVSTLPAGLKIAPRKPTANSRPRSRESGAAPTIALPPPPPIPTTPTSLAPHSPHSVRSLPAIVHKVHSPGMTQEKQRLMKAVEMRKKQMKAKQEKDAAEAAAAARALASGDEGSPIERRPSVADLPPPQVVISRHSEIIEESISVTEAKQISESLEDADTQEDEKEHSILETDKEPERSSTSHSDHRKSDSAVEIQPSESMDGEEHQSVDTTSSPTSLQGSTTDQSTRPSSVSEEDILPATVYMPKLQIDAGAESEKERSVRESISSSPTVVPEEGSPNPAKVKSALSDEPPSNVAISEDNASLSNLSPSDERDDSIRGRGRKKPSLPNLSVDPSPVGSRNGSLSDRKEKRRAIRESLLPPGIESFNDDDYLSDEDFMEELQSATVLEAKPMSVSKSPITPFFPSQRKGSALSVLNRPGSSPENGLGPRRVGSSKGVLELARSFSGASDAPSSDRMAVANKSVSSGISQRIKALAEKSNRDSVASIGSVSPLGESVNGMRTPSQSPPMRNAVISKPTRLNRASVALFQNQAAASSQTSMAPSPRETVHATVYNVEQSGYRPESVSDTARIIRDDRSKKPDLSLPAGHSPLELHQSPLIIDHQPAANREPSRLNVSSRPSTVGPVSVSPTSPFTENSTTPGIPRSSSELSWRSLRRRSEAKSPPPLMRNKSEGSLESHDEETKDKRKSRTSRLMKRMSSSLSNASRKSLAQVINPTFKEDSPPSTAISELTPVREPPAPIQLGDLNVQFPDTLLWKRRHVEIDNQGYLVLSVSKTNDNVRGVTRKFHLTELRAPYIPDPDRQELPNSVMLDFLDGSTLQCACESQFTQATVLQTLRESHRAWLAFNQ